MHSLHPLTFSARITTLTASMLGLMLASSGPVQALEAVETPETPEPTARASENSATACPQQEIDALIRQWRNHYLPAALALRSCGEQALSALKAVMEDEEIKSTTRGLSARLIAQIGSPEAVETILNALRADSPESTSAAALVGLSAINADSPVAIETLIAALSDEEEKIQVGAAYALSTLGPKAKAAIPQLTAIIDIHNRLGRHNSELAPESLRAMSIYAMGQIDPLNHDVLTSLAYSTIHIITGHVEKSPLVRAIAAEALRNIDRQENLPALLTAYGSDPVGDVEFILADPANPTPVETILDILSDTNASPEMRRGTLRLTVMQSVRQPALMASHFRGLSNALLTILDNDANDFDTRYWATLGLTELVRVGAISAVETLQPQLTQLHAKEQNEEIRYLMSDLLDYARTGDKAALTSGSFGNQTDVYDMGRNPDLLAALANQPDNRLGHTRSAICEEAMAQTMVLSCRL
ncbi:MAG: HEAT repeat domain-containing protein [Cyanobacteria bacterium P01_A01_bin.116]